MRVRRVRTFRPWLEHDIIIGDSFEREGLFVIFFRQKRALRNMCSPMREEVVEDQ